MKEDEIYRQRRKISAEDVEAHVTEQQTTDPLAAIRQIQ